MKRDRGAVAVDLGASSARYAAGWIEGDRIEFEVVRKVPHEAKLRAGRLHWDFSSLIELTREAAKFARETFEHPTIGIDSWAVDHGFLNEVGHLAQPPVCYRDHSHSRIFEEMRPHHERLFRLTGIQNQPFNTIFQLAARRKESRGITEDRWLLLPDLIAFLLGAPAAYEHTNASSTGLMGLDGQWCEEAFRLIEWPVPERQPVMPGRLDGEITGVPYARVGTHDTASAVCGFGHLGADQMFLNVGTWSLLGTVIEEPLVSDECNRAGLTNERTVEGKVRLLQNIPGFYVLNRLHHELKVPIAISQWIENADMNTESTFDQFHPDLYNPSSMASAVGQLLGSEPATQNEWAGVALRSLTRAIGSRVESFQSVTGRTFKSIRVGGGGSQSETFCRALSEETGLEVIAGPAEVTLLGNLGLQMLASGQVESSAHLQQLLGRSADTQRYSPERVTGDV